MSSVTRQPPPGRDDHEATEHRQTEHEIPGRRAVTEVLRQVVPQPVLEIVNSSEEKSGDHGGRHTDGGTEQNQAEVGPPVELRRRHKTALSPDEAPVVTHPG